MTKQEKTDKICKIIGDNNIRIWTRLKSNNKELGVYCKKEGIVIEVNKMDYGIIYEDLTVKRTTDTYIYWVKNPVMIWDVLSRLEETLNESDDEGNDNIHTTIFLWSEYRKPIADQPEECIDFIYRLLPND